MKMRLQYASAEYRARFSKNLMTNLW